MAPVTQSYDPRLVAMVVKAAKATGADPTALLATAIQESGARFGAVGDGGTSYGPFQFHKGGALANHDAAWANSYEAVLNRAQQFAKDQVHHGKGAAIVQGPLDKALYAQGVDSHTSQAAAILKHFGLNPPKPSTLPLPDGSASTVAPPAAPSQLPITPVGPSATSGAQAPTGALTAGSFMEAALQSLGVKRHSSLLAQEGPPAAPTSAPAAQTLPLPDGSPSTITPPQNSSPASFGTVGYVSPFSKASGLRMERTDQGVDAVVKPGSPITAMTDGVVAGIIPNWYKGQPMVYTKVTSGPRKGQYIYYSEGITPNVKVGDTFKAGQPIATATNQPTGMEFGFAKADGTVLTPYGNSPDGTATPGGKAFSAFLKALNKKR